MKKLSRKYFLYFFIILLIILLIIDISGLKSKFKYKNIEFFSNKDAPPFPIDFVISWAGEKINNDSRTTNNNELKYCLRSIFKNAPWLNRVFILMNPPKKIPSWFNNEYSKKITIIDHNSTFNKKDLPSTNSNAIETTIANIPELSEHFIYMNDDFYIAKPVSYKKFFTPEGKILFDKEKLSLCGEMHRNTKNKILDIKLPTFCGISRHIPLPNKKSVINNFNNEYKDYIEWIRSIKTRYQEGNDECRKKNLKSWCQQQHNLVAKYAYDKGEGIPLFISDKDALFNYLHNDNKKFFFDVIDKKPLFFCINDKNFKNLEDRNKNYKIINFFLDNYFKEKPFFEK